MSEKVAKIYIHSRHLLITTNVSTGDNDLKIFQRELKEAVAVVKNAANKSVKVLKRHGRTGRVLNVGISPGDGQLGVVVEFGGDDVAVHKGHEKLHHDLEVSSGNFCACLVTDCA